MSNTSQTIAAAIAAAPRVALSDRVTIPVTLTRAQATEIARQLFSSPSAAFSGASRTAVRDSFVSTCASLAISAMLHGDSSRLERLERYAATLPEYRKNAKTGEIAGNIGKLVLAYRDAVAIGRSLAIASDCDQVDLTVLANSPVFGALIEVPKTARKAIEKPAATPAATTKASMYHQEAIAEGAYFGDKFGENPHFDSAMAEVSALRAKRAEAIQTAKPEKFIDLFAVLVRDRPEQAEVMLRQMAETLGFRLAKVPTKKPA